MDGRFTVQRGLFRNARKSAAKRERVTEYLNEIYHTLAESMPELNPEREIRKDAVTFRSVVGKRPKHAARDSRGKDKSGLRLLPPGTFTDYLRLLNSRLEPEERVSLKLFSKVSRAVSIRF